VGQLVTINVYQRTFRIGYDNSHGTCFAVDVSGRQYIVTARHVLPGIGSDAEVTIFWKDDWRRLEVNLVGVGAGDVDIAVLAVKSVRLSPDFSLPATGGGLVMGQDVYFLGFPYNLFTDLGQINREFPMAFVKKAIVSSMGKDKTGVHRLFLDGHNNPGFSGGPIVWSKRGQNDYKRRRCCVRLSVRPGTGLRRRSAHKAGISL
jgi:S1-C subfamily serine protease